MKKFSFDSLNPTVKHVVVGFISGFASVVVNAVVASHGITGVKWASVSIDAVNAGALGAVSIASLMWLTPLTHEYGVGSSNKTPKD